MSDCDGTERLYVTVRDEAVGGDCGIEIVDSDDGVKDVVDVVVVLEAVDNKDGTDGDTTTGVRGTDEGIVTILSVDGLVGELGGGVGVGSLSSTSDDSKEIYGDGYGETGTDPTVEGSGIVAANSSSSGIVGTIDGAYRLTASSSISLSDGVMLILGVLVNVDISSGTLGSFDNSCCSMSSLGSVGPLTSLRVGSFGSTSSGVPGSSGSPLTSVRSLISLGLLKIHGHPAVLYSVEGASDGQSSAVTNSVDSSEGQTSAVPYAVEGAFSAVSYVVEIEGVGVGGGSFAV